MNHTSPGSCCHFALGRTHGFELILGNLSTSTSMRLLGGFNDIVRHSATNKTGPRFVGHHLKTNACFIQICPFKKTGAGCALALRDSKTKGSFTTTHGLNILAKQQKFGSFINNASNGSCCHFALGRSQHFALNVGNLSTSTSIRLLGDTNNVVRHSATKNAGARFVGHRLKTNACCIHICPFKKTGAGCALFVRDSKTNGSLTATHGINFLFNSQDFHSFGNNASPGSFCHFGLDGADGIDVLLGKLSTSTSLRLLSTQKTAITTSAGNNHGTSNVGHLLKPKACCIQICPFKKTGTGCTLALSTTPLFFFWRSAIYEALKPI